MSFHLIDGANLASNSQLIKACEVVDFVDAAALLREARRMAAEAEAADAEARRIGYDAGLAEGQAEAERLVAAEVGRFAEAVEAIRTDYAVQVAEAAYAATTAIIGELDDAEIVRRIVALQLARQDDNLAITLIVSPSVHAVLQVELDANSGIIISPDANMSPTDCHVINGQGRVIANLSLQLQVLRERWGLDAKADDGETVE
jgi:flagellar biosynthesis/type III secretory pathway protein FliH